MKILIIGDSPKFFGGVTNYTRPLAEYLSENNEVTYLFNSTRTGHNTFLKKRSIQRVFDGEYKYSCFELINGKSTYKNYDDLTNDYSNWMDELFVDFLDEVEPDVIHINEFFGFSTSVFDIIKRNKIKLIITIHEYWWLCPHRVMVDYNNEICEGPTDMRKCSFCVSKVKSNKSSQKENLVSKIKHDFPLLMEVKKRLKKNVISTNDENLEFLNLTHGDYSNKSLESSLTSRLDNMIESLNKADLVIGVSEDVKNHLVKFGVDSSKILIQHIGSTIAEKTISHTKKVDTDNIVFGFIGGVGYYKGVHQMVDAFVKLPEELKERAQLQIYGKYDENYFNAIQNKIITNKEDRKSIVFYGRFTPNDLPKITNKIDINILPSLCADTAPQTIFESYSNGLSIIAPIVGGFPDFVIDGVNGLLYEKASVEGLSNCMKRIIEAPELITKFNKNIPSCKTMGENTKELFDLYFDK